MYSFISEKKIIDSFKKSQYFKTDLGKIFMPAPKQGEDKKFDYTNQDNFMQHYLTHYASKLYKEGSIGQISFFTDWKMKDTVVVYYGDEHHFVFEHKPKEMIEKGVDKYLGGIIKEIETNYIPELIDKEDKKEEATVADKARTAQEKIKTNPGNISYDDIKDLLKTRRLRR